MISHKHEFIHVHIQRTGGASIARFFNNRNLYDHRGPGDYIRQYGRDVWDSYFKFALVRNPWAKVVGHYFWRQQRAWWLAKGDNMEFKEWVKNLDQITGGENGLQDPNINQIDWLTDPSGKILVDYVGRLADIDRVWPKICKRIGIEPKPLPRVNDTKHDHYSTYYDRETREIVAERYEKDIEFFNFEFNDRVGKGKSNLPDNMEKQVEERLESLGYMQ